MTTASTSLLGLALPVQGELEGAWGDTINNQITSLLDSAVAGTTTLSTDVDVTLTTTALASNQAREAILLCTGARTGAKTITAPAQSKVYVVVNATTGGYAVNLVGVGPTAGVSIANGRSALVAWTGSDFAVIATNDASVLLGVLGVTHGGTGLAAGTSGGVPYFSGTTTIASSAALAANALVIGGGAGVAPATTTTGTGVLTALGNAVNTAGGAVTQSGTLAASALLIGGGSGTAVSSTTTGTGVVTALGNAVNTAGGTVTQSGTLAASALLVGGGSGTAVSSTTTGTGVLTALAANANATSGFTTTDGAATLGSKRINPRVSSTGSTASITPDIATYDQYCLTAQAVGLTINAPTGTPLDGNKLVFRILDSGSAQTITWNGTYTAIGVTLPTTTTASKTTYVGCVYNANNTRWDVIAVTTEA